MNVIAIDPGMSGAIACLDVARRAHVADLPVIDTGLDKYLDGRGIYDILLEWVPVGERCIVVVEDVRVRNQGNGGRALNTTHSQTSLIRSRGIIEGACSIARMPIVWCTPQKWKRHFNLKRDTEDEAVNVTKEKSRQMALTLFPGMHLALARKMDQNRAESLLMAHWGRATQL